jgi:putative exporter of polyketide antibiotics
LVGDLLRWTVVGSMLLVVVLAVGGISAERGTLADSVLSRGISRYQYFLAKLHSRLACVLLTFTLLTTGVLVASHFLVNEDLSLTGSLVALAALATLLMVVATVGVSVGALSHNPVFGIAVLWLILCGAAFVLSLLPSGLPTPDRILTRLPLILRGQFDWQALQRMIGVSFLTALVVSLMGLVGFARSDV